MRPQPQPTLRCALLIIEDDRESADYLVKRSAKSVMSLILPAMVRKDWALAEGVDYDVLVVDRMLPKTRTACR